MKTVYFISSRTCSPTEKYRNHLLFIDNLSKLGSISLPQNPDKNDDWDNIKSFVDDENAIERIGNENENLGLLLLKCKILNNPDDSLIQEIRENRAQLIERHILSEEETEQSKAVYQLNLPNTVDKSDWALFAVHEICESDNQADIDVVRSQWCDLLIQYILDNVQDVENIHLFLHDRDVAGYEGLTQQLIDGVKSCKEQGLISDEIERKINKKNLTITFFKHSNTSCIMDIIGYKDCPISDRISKLQQEFENAFIIMKGVAKLKRCANERKKELEEMREYRQSIQ